MEKIHILGTGNAMVTECYNTCFSIEVGHKHLLVDTGGGNGILKQLKDASIKIEDIEHIFISHNHIDHIMGAIWIIRAYAAKVLQNPDLEDLRIYGHDQVILILETMCDLLLNKKQTTCLASKMHLMEVKDGQGFKAGQIQIDVIDIRSSKDKQFGAKFTMPSGKTLMFLGDEPYKDHMEPVCRNVDFLFHEAFCLDEEKDLYEPYKKHHCTMIDACKNGTFLGAKNLIIYHTEEKNLKNRKKLYTEEGRPYYKGNLFVPDDLEVFIV